MSLYEPAVQEIAPDPGPRGSAVKALALSGVAVPAVFGLCLWASGPPQRPAPPTATASATAVCPLAGRPVPEAQAAKPSDGTWQFTLVEEDEPDDGPTPPMPSEARS
jgi:hypothetical protein